MLRVKNQIVENDEISSPPAALCCFLCVLPEILIAYMYYTNNLLFIYLFILEFVGNSFLKESFTEI